MKVLELFSGTGSVGKCCEAIGWDVISVDLLLPATHECDIMDFDYKQYSKDEFDIVWGSPPCTAYSNLQGCWLGRKKGNGILFTKEVMEKDMDEADKLVLKTLEIIDYFKPHYWFIENPQTGKLKNREIMKNIPFYDCDYCMFSDWGYKKRTRIWTNKEEWETRLCDGSGACGNMILSQHQKVLGNGYEMIDGKKVLCNTKELRIKHKKNVANDVHSVKYKKHKLRIDGCSKWVNDNGKIINCSSVKLKEKYKDYPNIKQVNKPTTKLDRYRIPEDLIFSLFLD